MTGLKQFVSTILALSLFASATYAQDTFTSFNYQGQIKKDGKLVTGTFNFRFSLYDGPDIFNDNLLESSSIFSQPVDRGSFNVVVDFGDTYFDGSAVWMETCIQEQGDMTLTCLTPFQRIYATPYAIYSANTEQAQSAVNADQLDQLDSTDFLRRTAGCDMCIGHADNSASIPTDQVCFDLSSNGRDNSNFLEFVGDVDENDRIWFWLECP